MGLRETQKKDISRNISFVRLEVSTRIKPKSHKTRWIRFVSLMFMFFISSTSFFASLSFHHKWMSNSNPHPTPTLNVRPSLSICEHWDNDVKCFMPASPDVLFPKILIIQSPSTSLGRDWGSQGRVKIMTTTTMTLMMEYTLFSWMKMIECSETENKSEDEDEMKMKLWLRWDEETKRSRPRPRSWSKLQIERISIVIMNRQICQIITFLFFPWAWR